MEPSNNDFLFSLEEFDKNQGIWIFLYAYNYGNIATYMRYENKEQTKRNAFSILDSVSQYSCAINLNVCQLENKRIV